MRAHEKRRAPDEEGILRWRFSAQLTMRAGGAPEAPAPRLEARSEDAGPGPYTWNLAGLGVDLDIVSRQSVCATRKGAPMCAHEIRRTPDEEGILRWRFSAQLTSEGQRRTRGARATAGSTLGGRWAGTVFAGA
jgi:hypothetical protein